MLAEQLAVAVGGGPVPTWRSGRTSTLPSSALGSRAAHFSASSSPSHSISVKPPNTSLISAAGPSLSSVSPSRTRTVVEAAGGCSGAQSISTPASAIACRAAVQSAISRVASGVPGSGIGGL